MFPAGHLPDALLSAVTNQLGFCDLLSLQRVNRPIRNFINQRGLFPRKIRRLMVDCLTPKSGFVGTDDDDKLWVHAWIFLASDMEGWEFMHENPSGPACPLYPASYILLRHPTEPERYFPCADDDFLKLVSRSRVMIGNYAIFVFDNRLEQVFCTVPLPDDPRLVKISLAYDIRPFLRWFSATATLYLALGKNISNFELLRQILTTYRYGMEELELRPYEELVGAQPMVHCPRDDRLRCQQCVNRYGNAAPWNCVVCEEMWANWCEAKTSPGQLPEIGFPHIDNFSVSAVANLIDVAFCPARTPLRGQMLRVSGKNGAQDFDLTLFLREFERRLERVHDGRMELLEEAETDVETIQSWLLERLSVGQMEDAGISRRFYRMNAYRKRFLAAFLSSPTNFFAKHAKFNVEGNTFDADPKNANFLAIVFDLSCPRYGSFKFKLTFGHTAKYPSFTDDADLPKCSASCALKLQCGHGCKTKYGQPSTKICQEAVNRELPGCGHPEEKRCVESVGAVNCLTCLKKKKVEADEKDYR